MYRKYSADAKAKLNQARSMVKDNNNTDMGLDDLAIFRPADLAIFRQTDRPKNTLILFGSFEK
jgi:hypothetical protein